MSRFLLFFAHHDTLARDDGELPDWEMCCGFRKKLYLCAHEDCAHLDFALQRFLGN